MANVGTVTFDLAAEAAKLRSELDKVRKDVAGLRKTGTDMGDAITSGFQTAQRAMAVFGVAFGAAAIAQGLVRAAGAAIEMGDEIGKAASKAGVAASTMSELAYAARANDIELSALSTSLRKMQETTSLAAAGNKAATATVESLGFSVEQLRALAPDQQFEAFAQAISTIPNPADRARVAVDVFGRAGAELLPLFEQGANGVRLLREEAKALGVALSDDQVKRLQAADESVKKLKASFASLATVLVARAAPALTSFMDRVRVELSGTQLERIRKQIDDLEQVLATPGGRARFAFLDQRIAELRAQERALKEAARPPKSLAETRGARPLAIGEQDLREEPAKKGGTSALDQFLATRGGPGAGSGQSAGGGPQRQVFRNGRLVDESEEFSAGIDALGDEVQLEAQRVLNERKLDLEREFTAGKLAEIQNRESLVAELVRGSEESQSIYREAGYMSWASIIGLGVDAAAAGNKRLAKIQQGMALVQAVWNTASGISNALASVPFPGNIAAAAKVAAIGAIQIAKIKATSYSEGGGSGSAPSVGGGETGGAVQDRAGAQAPTQEVQARPQATIVINGPVMGGRETAEWIIEQLRDAVVDRDVVLIPSNSRQALELAGVGP